MLAKNYAYILYGLSNCDSTKKALAWFKKHEIQVELVSVKNNPISKEKLVLWCKQVGWKVLLNKRGTAFKALHPAIQINATTEEMAIEIMKERGSTMKRPIVELNNSIITVGFDEKKFEIKYL